MLPYWSLRLCSFHPGRLSGGLCAWLRAMLLALCLNPCTCLLLAAATSNLTPNPTPPATAATIPPTTPTPTASALARWAPLADTVFRHWTLEHGLPHPDVMSISSDRAGFLWLGTQGGLARWDGYRFRHFQPNPDQPGSLPDNYIQTLFLDGAQRLWIGSNGGGLARYDDEHERFIRVPGISHVHVLALADDGQGGLWVGTRAGLDHLSGIGSAAQKVENLHQQANVAGSFPAQMVSALLRDRQGQLWLGTEKGLLRQRSEGGRLQWQSVPLEGGISAGVISLKQSQDGRIWLGTRDHGAFWLDPAALAPASALAHALAESGTEQTLSHATIQAIQEVVPGELWLGSGGQGVIRVDLATLSTRRLRHDASLNSSLADNTVWSMWRDGAGLLWLGTQRGLSQYNTQQGAVLSLFSNSQQAGSIADSDVTAVNTMPDGSVWLGLLSQGLQIVDASASRIRLLRADGRKPQQALPPDRIYASSPPIQGWVYVATDRGLFRLPAASIESGKPGPVQRVAASELGGSVHSLWFDGKLLWIGADNGLWCLQPGANLAQAAPPPLLPALLPQLRRETITVIQPDPLGVLWLGTRHSGVYRFDSVKGQLRHIPAAPAEATGLSHAFVSSILWDSQQRLWVATQGGGINVWPGALAQGDSGPVAFKKIGLAEGLPNSLIDKLLQDQQGQVWASTDGGLAVISLHSLSVRALQKAEGGAIRVYWVNAGDKSAHGELIFGGAGGLTVVRPERLNYWQFQPRVVVSSLLLGGNNVAAGRINYLGAGAERLLVQPQANSLALEFAALDYSAPEQNRYRYRLDGFDEQWHESDASRRLASYTNLPPGDYALRLRGSNRNGVWSEAELVVPLRVLPAWHQSWWWHGCEALALLLAALGLVQARTRYLRQRQNELESQVWQQTEQLQAKQQQLLAANQQLQQANAALNQANGGLAESMQSLHLAQAQLVQQEKLASLGTLTAGIAHEINNPSNFAHVGAYVLGTELSDLQQTLMQLASDDASPEIMAMLQQRFDKMQQSLATISEGTSRIRDLVRDLRTFSRLDEADWKVVAIGDSLQATVNLVRTQYASQLEICCDLATNPQLACWPAQLNQVFMNLIVNACQAIVARPPETAALVPGRLQIVSRLEGDQLQLEFADNGVGIAPENLERIFDPFFTTKTVGEGMGMGLSISFGIIARHCGKITVSSRLGQGSCFTVVLPLVQAAAPT